MSNLLFEELLQKLADYKKIYVGFSAGIDSSVLLHCLAQVEAIKPKITAIHVNHGLSVNADLWESFAKNTCREQGVAIVTRKIKIPSAANLEEVARNLRYKVFQEYLDEESCLMLAHHQNDQAETVLLNLIRGTGIRGLAAMGFVKRFGNSYIYRPFLKYPKKLLEEYTTQFKVEYVDDESNLNTNFTRNYLRHTVIPLLEQKWPHVVKNIATAAENLHKEKDNLKDLAYIDCPSLKEKKNAINIDEFKHLPERRIINVIKEWLSNNKLKTLSQKSYHILINEIIGAASDRKPRLEIGEYEILRFKNFLYCVNKNDLCIQNDLAWHNFPEKLLINANSSLEVELLEKTANLQNYNIKVKFRKGGEVLLYKGLHRDVKKLMQEWKIFPWLRTHVPFIYINDKLIQIGNFLGDETLKFMPFKINWIYTDPISHLQMLQENVTKANAESGSKQNQTTSICDDTTIN